MQSSSSHVHRLLVVLTFCVLVTLNITGVLCCQNDPSLYFIDEHTIKCATVDSLDQPNPSFQTVVPNLAEGTAIDIDVQNRMIYWSDTHAWTINRMNLTSGEVKVIIRDNIGEVYSIAVEWESGLIYWTDFVFERIEVAKLNGSSRRTLITQDVESPIGIAVDPRNGHIYYTLIGVSPQIRRADIDGKNVVILVNVASIRRTTLDIALDKVNRRLYFSDESNNLVKYLDLASYTTHSVLSGNPHRPVGLSLFNGNLYWAGVGAAEMFSGAIYKADVKNVSFTSPIREVVDLLSYPTGIYADDGRISESPGYSSVCPARPYQTKVTSTVSVSSSTSISSASASSSLTTSYPSIAISSTPSIVYSSPANLAPNTTSFVDSISATPITDYCSTNDTCENGGSCQMDGLSYTCVCIPYFHGQHCSINYSGGTVVIIITIPGNQLNITELTDIIVKILNNLCEGESNSSTITLSEGLSKKQVTFTSEDIIVMEPRPVDENLKVELAVVKSMPNDSSFVISSEKLTQILLESVDEINQGLNGTIIYIAPKFRKPTTQTTPNSEKTTKITQTTPVVTATAAATTTATATATATPGTATEAPRDLGQVAVSTGGSNGGVIGGVVLVVVVIIIMVIALAVCYFRVKIPSLPFSYKRKTYVPNPGPRAASFENPGYDSTTGFGTGDDGLYSDLPQPMFFSPYEDLTNYNSNHGDFGSKGSLEQENKGQTMLCLETGEELEKVSRNVKPLPDTM